MYPSEEKGGREGTARFVLGDWWQHLWFPYLPSPWASDNRLDLFENVVRRKKSWTDHLPEQRIWRRISSLAARPSGWGSGMYRWKCVSPIISSRFDLAWGCRSSDFEKKLMSCRLVEWNLHALLPEKTNRFTEVAVDLPPENMELCEDSD